MNPLSDYNCLGEALRDSCLRYSSNIALIEADREHENRRLTYYELLKEAEGFAAQLQAKMFQPGDRCSIILSNQSKWISSALGALMVGAVLVPIDFKLNPAEQVHLLLHAEIKALVTEFPVWSALAPILLEANISCDCFVTEVPQGVTIQGGYSWEKEIANPSIFTFMMRQRGDVVCIVYTSGTSGQSRGVMHTHHNYLSHLDIIQQVIPYNEQSRCFSILPTNHVIDFFAGFIYPLMYGSTVIHQRVLRPQYLIWTMKHYQITNVGMVPLLIEALAKQIKSTINALPWFRRIIIKSLIVLNGILTCKSPNRSLSKILLKPIHDIFGGHLKYIVVGGAFLDPSFAAYFYCLGIPILIGYGLTETTGLLTCNLLNNLCYDTVGPPLQKIILKINEPSNEGVGEVFAKGETVMQGYFKEPELTEAVIIDGWLRTGDLGCIMSNGHLKLVGRLKNMIVTPGGKKVYPEDIEYCFALLPGVEEFSIFSTNFIWPVQQLLQEKLVIVLRLKENVNVDEIVEEIRKRNRKLVDFKRIQGYVLCKTPFPHTMSLKIKRNELAKQLGNALNRKTDLKDL